MEKVITIGHVPNHQLCHLLTEGEYAKLIERANATEEYIRNRVEDLWDEQSPHDLTITLRMLSGYSDSIIGRTEVWRVSLYAYRDDNETRKKQREEVASHIRKLISDWYDAEYGDVRELQKEAHRKMRRAQLLWRAYLIAGIVGLLTALILKFL